MARGHLGHLPLFFSVSYFETARIAWHSFTSCAQLLLKEGFLILWCIKSVNCKDIRMHILNAVRAFDLQKTWPCMSYPIDCKWPIIYSYLTRFFIVVFWKLFFFISSYQNLQNKCSYSCFYSCLKSLGFSKLVLHTEAHSVPLAQDKRVCTVSTAEILLHSRAAICSIWFCVCDICRVCFST